MVESSLAVSYKKQTCSPWDLTVAFVSIYFRDTKTHVHKRSCTWIFIPASFKIIKYWKKKKDKKCLSLWIINRTMVYTCRELIPSDKRERIIYTHKSLAESLRNYAKWKYQSQKVTWVHSYDRDRLAGGMVRGGGKSRAVWLCGDSRIKACGDDIALFLNNASH